MKLKIKYIEKKLGIKLRKNAVSLGLDTACYDDQTEVLTDCGWKLFSHLAGHEKVATLNSQTKEIEYQFPTDYIKQYYEGNMYNIKSKNLNLVTTKNHIFYYKSGMNCKDYKLSVLNNKKIIIPITAQWQGNKIEYQSLPLLTQKYRRQQYKQIRIKPFLQFLGWFLSEGHIVKQDYQIIICQKNLKYRKEISEILSKLPYKITKCKEVFKICNKQLYEYLKNNCYKGWEIRKKSVYNCYNKKIPTDIKQLSSDLLKYLYETLIKGDGCYDKCNNLETYYTSSKLLAGDIQELLLKLGYSSSCFERKESCNYINNRKIKYKHIAYAITKHIGKTRTILLDKHVSEINYKGNIYCISVPNEIIYIRRNGQSCWCGNTKTGYCIARTNTVTINFDVGYINLNMKEIKDRKLRNELRYEEIYKRFKDLIKAEYIVVVEDVFFGRNAQTLILLSRIGAIAWTIAKGKKCKKIIWKTAVESRKALGLPCNKKKIVVMEAMNKVLKTKIENDDIVDSIVLAINGLCIYKENNDK